jgi:hypothetical protein
VHSVLPFIPLFRTYLAPVGCYCFALSGTLGAPLCQPLAPPYTAGSKLRDASHHGAIRTESKLWANLSRGTSIAIASFKGAQGQINSASQRIAAYITTD